MNRCIATGSRDDHPIILESWEFTQAETKDVDARTWLRDTLERMTETIERHLEEQDPSPLEVSVLVYLRPTSGRLIRVCHVIWEPDRQRQEMILADGAKLRAGFTGPVPDNYLSLVPPGKLWDVMQQPEARPPWRTRTPWQRRPWTGGK